MLRVLLEEHLVDFVRMDVKAPLDRADYERAAGVRDESLVSRVRRSLTLLAGCSVRHELRTTVVPGIHKEDDIAALSRQLDGAGPYVLQSFAPERTLDDSLRGTKPYPSSVLADWQRRYAGGAGTS